MKLLLDESAQCQNARQKRCNRRENQKVVGDLLASEGTNNSEVKSPDVLAIGTALSGEDDGGFIQQENSQLKIEMSSLKKKNHLCTDSNSFKVEK